MDFQSLARSSMRDDSLTSEDDLHRIATASNINNGQPDPAAVRMIPDLYDPTDDDPLCPDSLRTLCPHSGCSSCRWESVTVAPRDVAMATDLRALRAASVNVVVFGPRSCAINQVHQCLRRRH